MKIKPTLFIWSFFLLAVLIFTPSLSPAQAALTDVGTCTDGLFAGGNGTQGNPWQIATPTQLANVTYCTGADYASKYFQLTQDINLSGFVSTFDANGWMPIGAYIFGGGYNGEMFDGTFNGNHHIISNLSLTREDGYEGLFGSLGQGSLVYDLGVENVDISSGSAGGIAGQSQGTIRTSYVSGGTISSPNQVAIGGIVGELGGGAIEDSYVYNVDIQGVSNSILGGVAGFVNSDARISRVYAQGTVVGNQTGYGTLGGIAGGWGNQNATLEDSFSLESVTATAVDGGGWIGDIAGKWGDLVGDNDYWYVRDGNPNTCIGGGESIDASICAPITDINYFKDVTNKPYDTWSIANSTTNINDGFPYLAWQKGGHNATTWLIAGKVVKKTSSVGGYASAAFLRSQGIKIAASETPVTPAQSDTPKTKTPENEQCPANTLIHQNMKAPARNGAYNSYTKAIVTEVKLLQGHMNRLGFESGPEDGILGKLTDGAIKRMQIFLGTTPDGMIGPITRNLINNSCGSAGLQKA